MFSHLTVLCIQVILVQLEYLMIKDIMLVAMDWRFSTLYVLVSVILSELSVVLTWGVHMYV